MMLTSLDSLPDQEIEVGRLLTVTVVKNANYLKDLKEAIRGIIGGRMVHYESLIQNAVDEALEELEKKANSYNYDGVIGLKIAHPVVAVGAVEILVYGNGFRNKTRLTLQDISPTEQDLEIS